MVARRWYACSWTSPLEGVACTKVVVVDGEAMDDRDSSEEPLDESLSSFVDRASEKMGWGRSGR